MDRFPSRARRDRTCPWHPWRRFSGCRRCRTGGGARDPGEYHSGMRFTAEHVTQNWHLAKPAASGKRGMVVSQSKNAAEAGVAVLDAGGNAIDAALAAALALAAI